MAVADFDYIATRNEIIEEALHIIGAISLGESPSAEQVDQGTKALNDIVDEWQNRHVFLWSQKFLNVDTSAATASYALGTDPHVFAISQAFLRKEDVDYPLEVISYREYMEIPEKSDEGEPSAVAVDGAASPYLYVWPTPDATYDIRYIGIVRLADFDTAAGTSSFNNRWGKALKFQLAADLAPKYGLSVVERNDLERKADRSFRFAKNGDRERSAITVVKGAYPVGR